MRCPRWCAICKLPGTVSGSSFSQRNLFELAIDRLAAEVAAISRTEKAVAMEQSPWHCTMPGAHR